MTPRARRWRAAGAVALAGVALAACGPRLGARPGVGPHAPAAATRRTGDAAAAGPPADGGLPGAAGPASRRPGAGDDGDEGGADDGDEGGADDGGGLAAGADGPQAREPSPRGLQRGWATWYGKDWHGKPTASGERFDMHDLTAAHRTLPLGAVVRVTNERNGRSVDVRINDRGPFGRRRERIIDLSLAAARRLGFVEAGACPVTIEVRRLPAPRARRGRR